MALIVIESMLAFNFKARQWCSTALVPALWRQRQVDFCEFKASLVYNASSRTDKATHRENLLKPYSSSDFKE